MSGRDPRAPLLLDRTQGWALIQADSLSLLQLFPDACANACVTDPPYGLSMSSWDGGYLADPDGLAAFTTVWARELARVLKPGGHAAIFGAPRTFHRLVAGVEDAGLEVRDQLLWLYGSGVPKSRRMPGGLGSSLAPRYEPILIARRPLGATTIAANVDRHGTGALNIDGRRVARTRSELGEGFWPGNLALNHNPACRSTGCDAACPKPLIDRIADGVRAPGSPPFSRLFYAGKASRSEREAGLSNLPATVSEVFSHSTQTRPRRNHHATVKPLAVARWLVGLVAPPRGLVIDPFAGSGSIGIGALLEGREYLGLEREPDYVRIASARLRHWSQRPDEVAPSVMADEAAGAP